MVGLEGLGSGTSGDRLHHGGLHLQEIPLNKEISNGLDDFAPQDKDLLDLVIDDQVQVSLPVPYFYVG